MNSRILNLLTILVALLGLSCDESAYPEHPDYTLSGKAISYGEDKQDGQSYTIFPIILTLTAKRDSLPPVWFMTCSWDASVVVEHESIGGGHNCDANFWGLFKLNTHNYLEFETSLVMKGKKEDWIGKQLDVGLIIIDTLEIENSFLEDVDPILQEKRKNREGIVWCKLELGNCPEDPDLELWRWGGGTKIVSID